MTTQRDRTRIIEAKYKENVKRLSAYWPSEFPTLEQVKNGKRSIRLVSGLNHEFDDREVERLLESIPKYFHPFMKIPITLRYEKEGSMSYYKVLGDIWQRRMVEIMIYNDYSYNGLDKLTVDQFILLLSRYKTLIFVTIQY